MTVAFALSAASPAQFPQDGLPEVAFLGRSNVGKSSLLNALAGTKGLARVSGQPGRTQLINFFRVSGGAFPGEARELYLVDLPGYGYARVAESVRLSWEKLVSAYLTGRDSLRVCVVLVDARHEPMEGDLTLRTFLEHGGVPYVVAATKADKLGKSERQRRLRALRQGMGAGAQAVTTVSAVTRDGVDDLWRTIRTAAARPPLEGPPGAPENRTDV
jgi:GTP-binding protein